MYGSGRKVATYKTIGYGREPTSHMVSELVGPTPPAIVRPSTIEHLWVETQLLRVPAIEHEMMLGLRIGPTRHVYTRQVPLLNIVILLAIPCIITLKEEIGESREEKKNVDNNENLKTILKKKKKNNAYTHITEKQILTRRDIRSIL